MLNHTVNLPTQYNLNPITISAVGGSVEVVHWHVHFDVRLSFRGSHVDALGAQVLLPSAWARELTETLRDRTACSFVGGSYDDLVMVRLTCGSNGAVLGLSTKYRVIELEMTLDEERALFDAMLQNRYLQHLAPQVAQS